MENLSIIQFLEKYGRSNKIQRYQTCDKRKKKELFGVPTNLSYNKAKFVSNRNEKNNGTHEKISSFSSINIRNKLNTNV